MSIYSGQKGAKCGAFSSSSLLMSSKALGVVVLLFSHVQLSATPWTVACQAPLSVGFSGKSTGAGCHFPPPEDLPDSGIKTKSPVSPALQVNSLPTEP